MKTKSKQKEINPKSIIIAAAGTGGHIMPAWALAEQYFINGWKVIWLGTPTGMENKIINKNNVIFISLNIGGFRGKKLFTLITYPFKFLYALIKSCYWIIKFKASNVVVFGGYISLPAGYAAIILKKNLFIHEQNIIYGTSNRLLTPFAKKIFTAFKVESKYPICISGNPIRKSILNIKKNFNKTTVKINVLVIGGSLGAKVFNEKLPQILLKFPQFNLIHQCGAGKKINLDQMYSGKAKVLEFIEDMGKYYQWADLVIGRAGAMTIAELEHVGLPSILIPYPYAIDDHQQKNAEYLSKKGGAMICKEQDITLKLEGILQKISKKKCIEMAKRLKSSKHKNAASLIFSQIENNGK